MAPCLITTRFARKQAIVYALEPDNAYRSVRG